MTRWLQYQKERFPLAQYVPMMAAFSFCAVSFSLHLHNPDASLSDVSLPQYITAAVTTLFFFMMMRIADEHKDYEEDREFRPYRPVQRGLIKLSELRVFGAVLIIIQAVMAVWVDWRLIIPLAAVYSFFTFMSFEFFVPKWLKRQHTLYLLSHMLIMPMIDLYATAVEWLPRGGGITGGILFFMASSYCDGTVVEVGRKLRAPESEEYGVDTYTQIWGPKKAMAVWLTCLTVSMATTVATGFFVNAGWEILAVLSVLYCFAVYFVIRFVKDPTAKNAKPFNIFPGVWMILMYLMLGIIPFFK